MVTQPAHPAIITRATWEATQTVGAEHGSSRDEPGLNTHLAANWRTNAPRPTLS